MKLAHIQSIFQLTLAHLMSRLATKLPIPEECIRFCHRHPLAFEVVKIQSVHQLTHLVGSTEGRVVCVSERLNTTYLFQPASQPQSDISPTL